MIPLKFNLQVTKCSIYKFLSRLYPHFSALHGHAKPLLPLTSMGIPSCPTKASLNFLAAEKTVSESSRDKAMLLTSGVPLLLSVCSCTVPNVCSLRAAGCRRCGWHPRGSASSTGAWYGSGGIQLHTLVESVRTKKLKTKCMRKHHFCCAMFKTF